MNAQMNRYEYQIVRKNINFYRPSFQPNMSTLAQFRIEKCAKHVTFRNIVFTTTLHYHIEIKIDHLKNTIFENLSRKFWRFCKPMFQKCLKFLNKQWVMIGWSFISSLHILSCLKSMKITEKFIINLKYNNKNSPMINLWFLKNLYFVI